MSTAFIRRKNGSVKRMQFIRPTYRRRRIALLPARPKPWPVIAIGAIVFAALAALIWLLA